MSSTALQMRASTELDLVVVDDNQLTLEIVSWILRGADVRFQVYNEPIAALEAFQESMPKMLITDFFMPAIDGIEFLTRFRAMPTAEHCDVFLCSAVELEPEQSQRLELLEARLIPKKDLCDKAILLGMIQANEGAVNR